MHKENTFIDFNRDRLLPQMHNNEGPAMAVADINGDGVTDVFIGGAKNQTSALFLSQKQGYQKITAPFIDDKTSEDTNAIFWDSDQDGDLDLYVCSGGKNFSQFAKSLDDRLYENQEGRWVKKEGALPFENHFSTASVVPIDINRDGREDLFVGQRFAPQRYGLPVSSYVFINKGNNQFEVSKQPSLDGIGMVTDAAATDVDQDGWMDLVVVGEWMPVTVLVNKQGQLQNETERLGMSQTKGLWNTIRLADLNQDGTDDWIVGNLGTNSFFEAGMKMFVNDYDQNGSIEQLICKEIEGHYYPIVDKEELISQLPALKKKIVHFDTYAQTHMEMLFSREALEKSIQWELNTLKSSVFLSSGQGFERQDLPSEVQYAPIYAIAAIDRAGSKGILFGGNQFLVKPQFGKYDASRGWFVPYSQENGKLQWGAIKSLHLRGQIRAMAWRPEKNCLLIGMNNEALNCYELE